MKDSGILCFLKISRLSDLSSLMTMRRLGAASFASLHSNRWIISNLSPVLHKNFVAGQLSHFNLKVTMDNA